jgi:hypothetical protein
LEYRDAAAFPDTDASELSNSYRAVSFTPIGTESRL